MVKEETVWKLLAGWGVHPGNTDIVRRTVYTFHSLLADTLRDGHVLLM